VINPAGDVLDPLGQAAPVFAAFLLAAALEIIRPWRAVLAFTAARWLSNLALFVLTTGVDYLTAPLVATLASQGLTPGLPFWVQLVIGILALDALNYGLHRGFHASPLLWRLHALHHADPELDITTTVRHHPGEALLMAFAIGGFGGVVGLSPLVVGFYGSLCLCVQFFSHANIGLPSVLATALGWLVVTPDLHRVHHSRHPADFDANFGAAFSFWDRLFATYRGVPEHGEDRIEFGIDRFREQSYQRLDRMLWLLVWVRGGT
jgi:sterol desaturase/sphingolipid hydroxylase (fatty acid hydroxylase superfamily)